MILIKWFKSRIQKKRYKYGLYFSGREGNTREAQPKNRGTKGYITHPNYAEAGEEKVERTPNQIPQERPPKPEPNPKHKIP